MLFKLFITLWLALAPVNPQPRPPFGWSVDPKVREAIAFVESSFNDCAQRGQYRGRFQQGTLFSRDLGHPDSSYVLCNRPAAEKAFEQYQRKYWHLTQGMTLWIIVLHARGPGSVKKQVIPFRYLLMWGDAYARIKAGTLIVR